MNDTRRAEELIEKYLDDVLEAAELEELERLLETEPEVARLFNERAKTDQLIQSLLAPKPAAPALDFGRPTPAREPSPARRRSTWRMIRDHLWGPTGTVILHVLVLIALIRFVSDTKRTTVYDFEFELVEQKEDPLDPVDELPKWDPPDDPSDNVPGAEVPQDVTAPAEFEPPPMDDAPVDTGAFDIANDVPSVLILDMLTQGRTEAGRKKALDTHSDGMGRYTEPAVIKALEWLRKHQGPDGSWGPNKPAMTGLALLTFLAHGETTASERYGQTVELAIRFLVSQQSPDGRFCVINQPGSYTHAIATYAISEAYGMTRIPTLKGVMEKAVQVILDGQQPGGGWDYDYKKGGRRDTSVAGWQVQALKAAFIAGAENKGLREALDKAAADLKSAHEAESGRFRYTDGNSHNTDSITGIAVLCLQLTGYADARETRGGLQAIAGADCNWDKPPAWPMYAWYYITQARFHQGGSAWSRWNTRFARSYVRNQNADGSWTSPGPRTGSENGAETNLGPVYSTTLAALTLQVYYRVLPTYQAAAVEQKTPSQDPNDLKVDVL